MLFLVEARRVELLSENPFSQLSPSAADKLKFPLADAYQQASAIGSP